jgi:hypothetical protein
MFGEEVGDLQLPLYVEKGNKHVFSKCFGKPIYASSKFKLKMNLN